MTRPLCALVEVYPDESLLSVIVRSADANVVPNTAALLKHAIPKAGVTAFTPFTQTENAAGIGAFLGLSTQDTIARMFPAHPDAPVATINWYGTPLERRFVEAVARRYSPSALQIAAYGRSVWQIRPLPFCPETFELLHSDCPSCGVELGWKRASGIGNCDYCEAGLNRRTSSLSVADQIKYRNIADLVDVRAEVRSKSLALLPQPFCAWEPGHAFAAVVEFGALAATINDTDIDGVVHKLGPGNFSALGESGLLLGWDIILNWPNAFDDLVRNIIVNRGHHQLVQKILSPLKKFIKWESKSKTAITEIIRYRITETLCDLNLPFKRIPTSGPVSVKRKNSISITDAVKRFKVDRDFLKRIAKDGDCVVSPLPGVTGKYLFDKEKLDKKISLMREGVPITKFAHEIGLPSYCLLSFINFGIFQKISQDDLYSNSKRVLLQPDSVHAFVQRLSTLNTPVRPNSLLSLSNAMRAELSPLAWAEAFAAILSGELTAFIDSGEAPWADRIFIENNALRKCLQRVRSEPLPDVEIAACVAGPIIGFTDVVLGGAVTAGLIRKNPKPG